MADYSIYQWQQKVKEEFGVTAKELIISFAQSKYSKRLAAGAMGISRNTLIRYCKRNPDIVFVPQFEMRYECKPRNMTNPFGKNKRGVK
jgi:hypothetical protein